MYMNLLLLVQTRNMHTEMRINRMKKMNSIFQNEVKHLKLGRTSMNARKMAAILPFAFTAGINFPRIDQGKLLTMKGNGTHVQIEK